MRIKVETYCGTEYLATVDKTAKLTPHFQLYEMANNKGKTSLPMYIDSPESRLFMVMLEEFRVWYGSPITVNSGYRQPAYNQAIGGDPNSAHKIACACDFTAKHTEEMRDRVIEKWRQILKAHCVVGAINLYTTGYHLEAYSDVCYGAKSFSIRDYRGTAKDWK